MKNGLISKCSVCTELWARHLGVYGGAEARAEKTSAVLLLLHVRPPLCAYRVNVFHVRWIIAVIFSRQPPFRILSHGGNHSDSWFERTGSSPAYGWERSGFCPVLSLTWKSQWAGPEMRESMFSYSTRLGLTFSKTARVWKTAIGSARLFPPMWSVWCVADRLSCFLHQQL